jgi:hypothetical protein
MAATAMVFAACVLFFVFVGHGSEW